MAEGEQNQDIALAESYVDHVRDVFADQPQIYADFLDTLSMMRHGRIDRQEMIRRFSNLFRGHPELIARLNTFFPPGERIPPPNERIQFREGGILPRPLVLAVGAQIENIHLQTYERAFDYVNRVRVALGNQPQAWNQFLHAIVELENQNINEEEMIRRATNCLTGHPELGVALTAFLSPGYGVEFLPNGQYQITTP